MLSQSYTKKLIGMMFYTKLYILAVAFLQICSLPHLNQPFYAQFGSSTMQIERPFCEK